MAHDPRTLLEDIRHAASLVLKFAADRTQDDYLADEFLRSAVERQFEIIGEALNRLHKVEPTLAEQVPERRRIISFRNVLAHGYDEVDHSVVWKVIEDKLPALVQHVESQLTSMPAT